MNSVRARLAVLGAAALFSTGGAAIKSAPFSPWQVAGLRSGVAAVALALMLPGAWRPASWRPLLVAGAYAATLLLFVLATRLTTAANAIFLQSAAPLYVLLFGPRLLGERAGRADIAVFAVMAAGMTLFFIGTPPAFKTAPNPRMGDMLAVLAGLSWGLTLIGLRWLGRGDAAAAPYCAPSGSALERMCGEASPDAASAAIWGNILAFLAALPLMGSVAGVAPRGWLILAYLGVFQIALAYVMLTSALKRVPALEAALLLLLEPALNPVWAWLVHGERPGGWAVAGGAMILGATAARAATSAAYQENRSPGSLPSG